MRTRQHPVHHLAVDVRTAVTVREHDHAPAVARPPDDEVLPARVVAPLPDRRTRLSLLDAPAQAPGQLVVDADLRLELARSAGERVAEEPDVVGGRRVQAAGRRLPPPGADRGLRPPAAVV